jgi:hypothetical protein
VRRLARWLGAGQRHHAPHEGVVQRRLAGLAGGIPQQAVDPRQGEAPLPAPDRRPADADPPRHLGDAQALGRIENDPRPQRVLVDAVTIGDDRLEPSTIVTGHNGADMLGRPAGMPHLSAFVNPLIVSVH